MPVPILYTWVERDDVGQSILSKETTRWQGLGVQPPTFRSEVQRTNHYTTAPRVFLRPIIKTKFRQIGIWIHFSLANPIIETLAY